jgi:glucuronate isomerase
MLTDSRSFLSYVRHDYYRRILCSMIGEWVEHGEMPNDEILLERIIKGVSLENARKYFAI